MQKDNKIKLKNNPKTKDLIGKTNEKLKRLLIISKESRNKK